MGGGRHAPMMPEPLRAGGNVVMNANIDVLVQFSSDARHTLFDLVTMQDELRALFGRAVDLLSKRGIESSRNPLRRRAILESAEIIYAA